MVYERFPLSLYDTVTVAVSLLRVAAEPVEPISLKTMMPLIPGAVYEMSLSAATVTGESVKIIAKQSIRDTVFFIKLPPHMTGWFV